jgi:hypothetical protein
LIRDLGSSDSDPDARADCQIMRLDAARLGDQCEQLIRERHRSFRLFASHLQDREFIARHTSDANRIAQTVEHAIGEHFQ